MKTTGCWGKACAQLVQQGYAATQAGDLRTALDELNPQHYVFEDDQFTLTTHSPIFSGETRAQYSVLLKAYETDDFFVLYITPRQAYLIWKKISQ